MGIELGEHKSLHPQHDGNPEGKETVQIQRTMGEESVAFLQVKVVWTSEGLGF